MIAGRAAKSNFPREPLLMIENTMPEEFIHEFRSNNPFLDYISNNADRELDCLPFILESEGIKFYRPKHVDWCKTGGYTGSMPRDGFSTVRSHTIESTYAWGCHRQEIKLAFEEML